MKRSLILSLFALLLFAAPAFSAYEYGPALIGSYKNVTISVTAATSATIKAVLGSTSQRDLAILKNIGPTYDLYWGEGASITTVGTWNKLAAGAETTLYTNNFAPGTWGATNSGVYIYVSPTPYTADVANFRAWKRLR